jgi:hypothetical protein
MPPSDAYLNPMVLGHAAENGAQQMHLLPGEAWVVQVYLGAHGQFTFGYGIGLLNLARTGSSPCNAMRNSSAVQGRFPLSGGGSGFVGT